MLNSVLSFFKSTRTAIWLLLGVLGFLFLGSMIMPGRSYEGMNSLLLFEWLRREGKQVIHFWFWVVLALLGLLALNTLICSLDSVIRKIPRREFLMRVSPQLMHIGFLLILLAHFLSAGWGFKVSDGLYQGQEGSIPGGTIKIRSVDMAFHPSGMPKTWWADVEIKREGQVLIEGRIGPNKPLFFNGTGVYLKTIRSGEYGALADILVARDPGAMWALAGAVLFSLGNAVFLWLRIRSGS